MVILSGMSESRDIGDVQRGEGQQGYIRSTHAVRRERIASRQMAALLVGRQWPATDEEFNTKQIVRVSELALRAADALIAELDKEPADGR